MMDVVTTQLPADSGEDRLLVTRRTVAVLDGATSYGPDVPPATLYVDTLADQLYRTIDDETALPDVLREAIRSTAEELDLQPGAAPSSTVAIVRIDGNALDYLVLGDSPIIIGRADGSVRTVADTRLADLQLPESAAYRERLKRGSGYDERHRGLLRSLQRRGRANRNREGGYWIAEADPKAASKAITLRTPVDGIHWVVLATDGAANPIAALGISWHDVARLGKPELDGLLAQCHRWESSVDPDGQYQPRSKRHDDKTIAVIRL
ncbi:PP2C family serine/threonine-protein phosphatase [Nocardia abscessus]|uniref:PP2C family serine/threonine-protein phosphatase n=1 Tax=Nocardia abscessus TaxID=120957 RepID=UPI002453A415|nr:PP2C family serine/threonine-protein phosphatase [Nocardia abscessus]